MKTTTIVLSVLMNLAFMSNSFAQNDYISDELDVTIYPKDRQSQRTQQRDESKCYREAMDRTDDDVLNLYYNDRYDNRYNDRYARNRRDDDRREDDDDSNENSFTKRALGGAALGTLIGALSGNTTKGLRYGSLAGAAYGGVGELTEDDDDDDDDRRKDYSNREVNRFKRAFSSCMEDQDYYANY